MTTKTQKCPRCEKNRTRSAWAPKAWGKPGKWCRTCRSAHAKAKRAQQSKSKEA